MTAPDLEERVTALEATAYRAREIDTRHRRDLNLLSSDMREVRSDIAEIKTRLDGIDSRLDGIDSNIADMKTEMRTGFAEILRRLPEPQ